MLNLYFSDFPYYMTSGKKTNVFPDNDQVSIYSY